MLFFVQTLSAEGKREFSFYQAKDFENLLDILNFEEFIPQRIFTLPDWMSFLFISKNKKISKDNVVELLENMHLVVKSGLPLYRGIMDLAQDTEDKKYKDMLKSIARNINAGYSLEKSMQEYKASIGDVILNLVHIGEQTGQLEITLKRAADFLRKTITLKKKAKQALIYPSISLVAVTSAMLVWIIYVLPQMTQLFKQMDIKLPALTLAVMAMSDFLSHYILFVLMGIVIFVIFMRILYKKSAQFRFYFDKALLKIPIVSAIIKGFNIAFISEYLRMGIESGIPIVENLQSLQQNLGNEVFKRALSNVMADIEQGLQLSAGFKKSGIMTAFVVRMLSMGEESGSLDKQLGIVSAYYYEKVDYYAENIGKLIEPAVMVFVGGFMALIVLSIIGPVYDMVSKIH